MELGNLYKGFYRVIAQDDDRGRDENDVGAPAPTEQAVGTAAQRRQRNRRRAGKGKEPMSVELYRAICGWFLACNTIEGVFAYCFIVLTWNLTCRAHNTEKIKFRNIKWTAFDCYEVYFGHTKTDQLGDDAKHARHMFANPLDPLVSPVFALSLYLSCCFNSEQALDNLLFPGKNQYDRFSKALAKVLDDHTAEVYLMGYCVGDVGTHSIRKGVISYLASQPGGPPAASICIRAGWTMGKVKDIYMQYIVAGDQFVGRCLSMLPLQSPEFGCSAAYFSDSVSGVLLEDLVSNQFRFVQRMDGYGRLSKMCLASLLYHRDYIATLDYNHVIRQTSMVLRSELVVDYLHANPAAIVVSRPWDDHTHHFNGIPPHVTTLHELMQVKTKQRGLIFFVLYPYEYSGRSRPPKFCLTTQ